jgi:hypothetical protein
MLLALGDDDSADSFREDKCFLPALADFRRVADFGDANGVLLEEPASFFACRSRFTKV